MNAKDKAMKYFLDNIQGYNIPKNHNVISDSIDIAIQEAKKEMLNRFESIIYMAYSDQRKIAFDELKELSLSTPKKSQLIREE